MTEQVERERLDVDLLFVGGASQGQVTLRVQQWSRSPGAAASRLHPRSAGASSRATYSRATVLAGTRGTATHWYTDETRVLRSPGSDGS